MSGELVPSQFRWTTTANRDFVIGDPSDNGTNPRFLVFQVTDVPGYSDNPHIRAEYSGSAWQLKWSSDGSTLTSFALTDQDNTWSGTNTFSADSVFGTTSSDSLTVNSTSTFLSPVTISNSLTAGDSLFNGSVLSFSGKRLTVNKNGAAGTGTGAGLEVEENSSISAYISTSVDRNSWIFKSPNKAGTVTLTPSTIATTLVFTSTATEKTIEFPDASGTLALLSDITGVAVTADRAIVSDGTGIMVASSVTSTEIGYLSGVTANIQTTLASKAPLTSPSFVTDATTPLLNVTRIVPKTGNTNLAIGAADQPTYSTQSVTITPPLTTNALTALATITAPTVAATTITGDLASGKLLGKTLPASPGAADNAKVLSYNHSTGAFALVPQSATLPATTMYTDTAQTVTGLKTFQNGLIIKDTANSNLYLLSITNGALTLSLVV